MSWQPKTYEAHCCLCGASVSVDFLSLNDIFADKAYVLDYYPRVLLDEKKEKTNVDISLLCENCKCKFGITIYPEPKAKEDFITKELDPIRTSRQFPSFNVRNDANQFHLRVWVDKEIPTLNNVRDFRVPPLQTVYIGGVHLGWMQFVTPTDPTATIITTSSPFIIDIYVWDASANQMAPGYPKTIWPSFTNGPQQVSIALDVNDKLLFIFTPFWTKLLRENLAKLEELPSLTLETANQRLDRAYAEYW